MLLPVNPSIPFYCLLGTSRRKVYYIFRCVSKLFKISKNRKSHQLYHQISKLKTDSHRNPIIRQINWHISGNYHGNCKNCFPTIRGGLGQNNFMKWDSKNYLIFLHISKTIKTKNYFLKNQGIGSFFLNNIL